jgi:hypothetical protein
VSIQPYGIMLRSNAHSDMHVVGRGSHARPDFWGVLLSTVGGCGDSDTSSSSAGVPVESHAMACLWTAWVRRLHACGGILVGERRLPVDESLDGLLSRMKFCAWRPHSWRLACKQHARECHPYGLTR